jgi:POT family proton-dependent oligopeptide transporter
MFFLLLVIAAFVGGILIFAKIKSLNQIVRERAGSA